MTIETAEEFDDGGTVDAVEEEQSMSNLTASMNNAINRKEIV